MKRYTAILGILLTITILISSSALAQPTWHYAQDYSQINCTDPGEALYAPDDDHASCGKNTPQVLGTLTLDLGQNSDDWMGPNEDFTVWGQPGGVNESYDVGLIDSKGNPSAGGWSGYDAADLTFTTPSGEARWRYIVITGTSGGTDAGDPIYGPEIDAVGWYG